MLDALYPNQIPLADVQPGDLIAAYLGHASNPQSYQQAVDRFPGHQIVSIASHHAVDAQVLDIENGAVDPDDYPTINGWDARQLDRSVHPTHYCNTSTYPGIIPHLLVPSNWWAARWGQGQIIPAGAVGVQYGGAPGYDLSVMLDYIPGIDPDPQPTDGEDMIEIWWAVDPAGTREAWAVGGFGRVGLDGASLTALQTTPGRVTVDAVSWAVLTEVPIAGAAPVGKLGALTGTFTLTESS